MSKFKRAALMSIGMALAMTLAQADAEDALLLND